MKNDETQNVEAVKPPEKVCAKCGKPAPFRTGGELLCEAHHEEAMKKIRAGGLKNLPAGS